LIGDSHPETIIKDTAAMRNDWDSSADEKQLKTQNTYPNSCSLQISGTEPCPILSWNFAKWDIKFFKRTYISLFSFVCRYINRILHRIGNKF
jgi:hypothetical protein